MENNIRSLPVVPLRGMTVLPEEIVHFDVSRERSLRAIEQAMKEGQKLFVTAQLEMDVEEPSAEELYSVGCIVAVKQIVKISKQISRVLVVGEQRARIAGDSQETEYMRAEIEVIPDDETASERAGENVLSREAMTEALRDLCKEYLEKNPKLAKEFSAQLEQIDSLKKMVDVIAANLPMKLEEAQQILEETDLFRRYERISSRIVNDMQVLSIKHDIQARLKEKVDKNQREYILREEIRMIREELGDDSVQSDADEFESAARELCASDEVKEKLFKEIKRFRSSVNSPAEAGVLRTYIETLLDMPWERRCEERQDMKRAETILNEEHYGLEKVKERILEYLAVRILTKKSETPILCLYGPPGTGKTSIARSLAGALERPYVRISLGGVRDEAEIRGHRKTYVGAMPGRIAAGLRDAKVKNPLILLDEIDKVSTDYRGDTFSALLEVLDHEQNKKFRDHYLELPIDLSEVLFITTANTLQTIPEPLLDRMEIIEINSYTENEKMHIALEHLLPKQLERHGLDGQKVSVSKGAVWKMAHHYTKEAGVRQLERKIGDVCRKAAREILEKGKTQVHVTERNLKQYLGRELYTSQPLDKKNEVGIVCGLAWTSVGGDTLQIEVNVMPGEGEILLTGQLGDVMKESARVGITYICSVASKYQIDEAFFKKHDIHIHIPEGAIPKDGPSAGITMATAILSAASGRRVLGEVAMTGEITLRGRVLPIGGLKEKLLAAKNDGIKTVIIPEKNEADIREMSAEITKGLKIVPVSHMEEVLANALEPEK